MLHVLAKDGYVALKQEAKDILRWSHVKNLLYSRILEEEKLQYVIAFVVTDYVLSVIISPGFDFVSQ